MSGVVRQNVARADAALVARPGRAGVVTDRRNNDAPVGFKDRFGYSGCIAARGLSQVRRISAAALAAPAEGGSVRIWRVGLGCSESSVSDREKLVSVNDRSGETLCVATPYVLHMPTDAASAKAQKRMSEKSASSPLISDAANGGCHQQQTFVTSAAIDR